MSSVTRPASDEASLVDLVAEGFDLAFRSSRRRLRDSSLHARRVGAMAMQVFAAPAYLARRGTPRAPADLAAHDWVIYSGVASIRLENAGEVARLDPRGRVVCDDMSFVCAALGAGAGLGVLPTFLAGADVASGALVRVLPRWTMPMSDLWIVSTAAKHAPRKVTALRDFVIESLRARPLALAEEAAE